MVDAIGLVGVVVPAHDEEELLPAALVAIGRAADVVRRPRRHVDVVVVADACTDRTAAVARALGARVVETAARSVGQARAAGVRDLLARHAHVGAHKLWLATSDADSVVPRSWLQVQLRHADAGADLVLGTVDVADWSEHPPSVAARWRASYEHREGHRHVHGANAGARASAYLAVGGFADQDRDEDVALAAALRHRRVVRTNEHQVVTSARRRGRAAGGFADHLAGLG